MTPDPQNTNSPQSDDWKSFLPGSEKNTSIITPPSSSLGIINEQKKTSELSNLDSALTKNTAVIGLPDAPIPKIHADPLPPLEKIGLTPMPPKPTGIPLAPIFKKEISEIPIPPTPKLDNLSQDVSLPPPLKTPMPTASLQTVKTFQDDSLIAEGKTPEIHNINYDKISSDEEVNKFLKPNEPKASVAPPMPPNPILSNTPRSTNFNIKTPTGVHNPIIPPKPTSQDSFREPIPPIRKTLTTEPQTPEFNPKRFGESKPHSEEYDADITETKNEISNDGLSKIRTLRDDVNQVIEKKNVTLASIAIKEEERRRLNQQNIVKTSSSPLIIVSIVVLLMVSSGMAIWFSFYRGKTTEVAVVDDTKKLKEMIFTDSEGTIEVSNMKVGGLSTLLATETKKELRLTQIKNLRLINTMTGSDGKVILKEIPNVRILFDLLGLKAEDRLVRFLTDNYMIGVYSYTNKSAFLILEADDYSSVFAQMLVWENKGFAKNIYESLTGQRQPSDFDGKWNDEVIENLDTRVFRDKYDNPLVYWAFIDRLKTLVITIDKNALVETKTRFQTRTMAK